MEKNTILPFLAKIDFRGRITIPKNILATMDRPREKMFKVEIEEIQEHESWSRIRD